MNSPSSAQPLADPAISGRTLGRSPVVHVVIVNYRSAELSINCLRSLLPSREALPELKAFLVENDSGDAPKLRAALSDPLFAGWVDLIEAPKNGGYAYGNNLAVRASLRSPHPPEYFFLLNPDAELRGNALEQLLAFMHDQPQAAIVGPRLLDGEEQPWNWAFRFPNLFAELDNGLQLGLVSKLLKDHLIARQMSDVAERVDWLPGAAMLIRRDVFEKIGLLDETYFLYYEETDFLLSAAKAGLQCWYYPGAQVMHIAGQSTGVTTPGAPKRRLPDYWFESRRRYFLKNFGVPYACAADLVYGVGSALLALRAKVQRKENPHPPQLIRDLWRHSPLHARNRRLEPSRNY